MARLSTRIPPADPELARAGEALRVLADAWRELAVRLPDGVPSLEAAEARLESGVPGLTGEPLLDGAALLAAAEVIGRRLEGVGGYESAAAVAAALLRGAASLDLDLLVRAALAGAWDDVASLDRRLDVDGDAIVAVVDYAARPALRAGTARLKALIDRAAWGRGSCPACGAAPLLSITTGKEGERILLCGRCGAGWRYPRVRCAACGERDHRRLGALHPPGEGEYRRAETCETCRAYLKTISVLDSPDPDRLLRLDLETAALDFIALERGYRRG